MTIRINWIGQEPPDREAWEDVLRAEHGTATEPIVFHFEKAGDGYRLTRVEESSPSGQPPARISAVPRFVRALRMAGKPVIGLSRAEDEGELEAVGADALGARAEKVRREGGAGE
jgi:hypothetical protein